MSATKCAELISPAAANLAFVEVNKLTEKKQYFVRAGFEWNSKKI